MEIYNRDKYQWEETGYGGSNCIFLKKKNNEFFEIRYDEKENTIQIRTVYDNTGYKKRPKKSCNMFTFIKVE